MPSTSANSQQQTYSYHCVEAQPTSQRFGNRSSGCWTSSSVKVIQLCCMGILVPSIWILVPLHAKFFLYGPSSVPLKATEMRFLDTNISTIWCQGQDLKMKIPFDAFLMTGQPKLSRQVEPVTMNRHFVLDDDLKEYWGFYLLKGSQISVTSCAKYLGASVTLIKGETGLKRCASVNDDSIEDSDEILENNVHKSITHIRNNTLQVDDDSSEKDVVRTTDDIADDRGNFMHPVLDNELEDDVSTTSSSEETLKKCKYTLLHQPLIPDESCRNMSEPEGNFIRHTVQENDYYYFVFSSNYEQAGKEENILTVKFELLKTMFNMSEAQFVCRNTTQCHMPLRFASKERVIVYLPQAEDDDSSSSVIDTDNWQETYLVQSECDPRTPLYLAFGLSLPVLLILCAFL